MESKQGDAAGAEDRPEPRQHIDPDTGENREGPGEMISNESWASTAGEATRFRAGGSRTHLDPARLAEIRQRILDGAYDSLETVEQVARRILASGDL